MARIRQEYAASPPWPPNPHHRYSAGATAGERDDIHQLTKLVLPNLSESVPAEVREFLRQFLVK